jgi:hypothetical protein
MEMQQMMELLLARFNASMKERIQKMKAAIKRDREQMLAEISAEMNADRKKQMRRFKGNDERQPGRNEIHGLCHPV